jgi:tRNA pseudouridine38-40 synthase
LYLAGKGKIPPQKIAEILQERDRTKAGITAPACGLYLVEVRY